MKGGVFVNVFEWESCELKIKLNSSQLQLNVRPGRR